jgi:hypothetical protein
VILTATRRASWDVCRTNVARSPSQGGVIAPPLRLKLVAIRRSRVSKSDAYRVGDVLILQGVPTLPQRPLAQR